MTDGHLMEADCIHGKVWFDCIDCSQPPESEVQLARYYRTLEWLIEHQGVSWWNGKVFASVNGVREWVDAPAEVIEVLTEVDRGP